MAAARIVLDRLCPPRRSWPVPFKLPVIATPADLPGAMAALVAGVADGLLTPDEAAALGALLETQRRMFELTEVEARMRALEARHARA
jgi:hypothetical protein